MHICYCFYDLIFISVQIYGTKNYKVANKNLSKPQHMQSPYPSIKVWNSRQAFFQNALEASKCAPIQLNAIPNFGLPSFPTWQQPSSPSWWEDGLELSFFTPQRKGRHFSERLSEAWLWHFKILYVSLPHGPSPLRVFPSLPFHGGFDFCYLSNQGNHSQARSLHSTCTQQELKENIPF